jgi:hypothetical protein
MTRPVQLMAGSKMITPAARGQHPPELRQRRSRIPQVVPDIEKDEVRDAGVGETQLVGVLLAIEPGIGKRSVVTQSGMTSLIEPMPEPSSTI